MPTEDAPPDNATLQRWLLDHEPGLRRFISRRLGTDLRPMLGPDDVLQEVWIAVFRRISSFRPHGRGSFEIWLKSTAIRTTINLAKAARRHKRGGALRPPLRERDSDSSGSTLFDRMAGPGRTPSREVSRREAAHAIRSVLAQLPDEHRLAVQLRFFEGKGIGDISRAMGKSKFAVRSIIYRGLRQARARLGSSGRFLSNAPTTSFPRRSHLLRTFGE